MDLFNIVLGQDAMALPPIYGLLDTEFAHPMSHHSIIHSLDDVIHGKEGWAVHFSSPMGKPVQTKVNLDSVDLRFPAAHPGFKELFRIWYEEAAQICPKGSIPNKFTDMKDINFGKGSY